MLFNMCRNRIAFLDTIAHAEGTSNLGNNGFNVMIGGELFDDYSDHPRPMLYIPRYKIHSSAAGRYQLLSRYFDAYKETLGLDDFSPFSQDLIAVQQIKEQHALEDVDDGRFDVAVEKVSNIWASLPGSKYKQKTQKLASLREVFIKSGGIYSR